MISLSVCTVLAMALAAAQAHSEALYPRACPATPDPGSFSTAIPKLPDPFHFLNGQAVTTTGEWTCRQAEISTLLQKYELGVKPGAPDKLTASFSGNTLTITATVGSKSITFSPTITFPSSGTKPYPAIIGVGGASIPQPQGVAFINFNNNDLGAQDNTGSRGKGKFFDLYGPSGGAGATLAWAWGVSRILDALEATPGANIDPKRVGVTGCSRNGKGALIAGALDNRIALTIPQESGSGGTACWRLSDYMHSQGQDTQTASEIIGENVWFGTAFNTYASKSVNPLPFDHHLLAALVSPRPLFSIENTDYLWLGPYSSFGCMTATHEVYKALGKSDYHGFSQVGGHAHCSFPSKQQADLDAFVKRFLLGQSTNTAIFKTDGSGNFNFNPSDWINWTTPTLGSDGGGTTTPPTTTPPTTTPPTTTPPTTTTPPPTQPTQVKYGQCGGIGWTGPTVCASGTTCQKLNDYYSQCL